MSNNKEVIIDIDVDPARKTPSLDEIKQAFISIQENAQKNILNVFSDENVENARRCISVLEGLGELTDDEKEDLQYFKQFLIAYNEIICKWKEEGATEPIETYVANNSELINTIMPSSPVILLANQAINSLSASREINNDINRNKKYTWDKNNGVWSLTSTSKKDVVTVSFDDITILKGKNNKGFSKLFAYCLIKANEQNYSPTITFPLKDIVSVGMYSSLRSARKGFVDNIIKIMGLTFKGECHKGKQIIKEAGGKLFYHYEIENNYVTLYLNPQLNIEFLASYFTLMPSFAFKLNTNSFSLINYIFFLARQNTMEIKEKGCFNISLKAIHNYLCLPGLKETKEHSRLIKEPIEKAIEEIEEMNNDADLTITPYYKSDNCSVAEWLEGHLEIGLSGKYAKTFIEIAKKSQDIIEKSEKMRERAQEKAMQKTLEKVFSAQIETKSNPVE